MKTLYCPVCNKECNETIEECFHCDRCGKLTHFHCLKHGSAVECVEETVCKSCWNYD